MYDAAVPGMGNMLTDDNAEITGAAVEGYDKTIENRKLDSIESIQKEFWIRQDLFLWRKL